MRTAKRWPLPASKNWTTAAAEARAIVDKARRQAEETAADARLQAEAVLDTAKEQAHAQARRLVEAAAAEANEVQNAHQLRLNSMREEVRSLEQRREQLIVYFEPHGAGTYAGGGNGQERNGRTRPAA